MYCDDGRLGNLAGRCSVVFWATKSQEQWRSLGGTEEAAEALAPGLDMRDPDAFFYRSAFILISFQET